MSDQRIPSQWQLQNTGESLEQWMLHEEEQNLSGHMQLSQQQGADPEQYDAQYQTQYQGQYPQYTQMQDAWQPIDYRAMQQVAQRPASRSGLILGTLLVLALLSVGGYLAWFYAGQPSLPGMTARSGEDQEVGLPVETPAMIEETPAAAVVAPVGEVPTATPEPTAAPSPTPYLIEIGRVTVNSQFGVNARQSASADAEVIQLLENGANFLVANGPVADADGAQWYEIVLTDNQRAFVSADYVTTASEFVPYADAVTILAAAGLPTPAAPVADAGTVDASAGITTTAGLSETAAVTTTAGITESTDVSGTAEISTVETVATAPVQTSGVITVSATISAPAGVNLRGAPETGDNILQMVVDATQVAVIGRSDDGAWLQAQLEDGTRGWVSADFVVTALTGALDAIPLGTTQPLTATEPLLPIVAPATAEPTAAVTTTESVTTTAEVTTTVAPTETAGVSETTGTGTGPSGGGLGALGLPTATPSAETATLPTPTPGAAATPAAEEEATTGVDATVISVSGVNLRPEPSADSVSTTALEWNTQHTAVARSADSAWVQLLDADGTTGWVSASSVMVIGGVSVLPVAE